MLIYAVNPTYMTRVLPVTNDASSDSSYKITLVISSLVPIRFIGMMFESSVMTDSSN
jgi:hypothetical protein